MKKFIFAPLALAATGAMLEVLSRVAVAACSASNC
jgi:hypothetical protein